MCVHRAYFRNSRPTPASPLATLFFPFCFHLITRLRCLLFLYFPRLNRGGLYRNIIRCRWRNTGFPRGSNDRHAILLRSLCCRSQNVLPCGRRYWRTCPTSAHLKQSGGRPDMVTSAFTPSANCQKMWNYYLVSEWSFQKTLSWHCFKVTLFLIFYHFNISKLRKHLVRKVIIHNDRKPVHSCTNTMFAEVWNLRPVTYLKGEVSRYPKELNCLSRP